MRFAYIDSGGNEVPIPSVDALALRIELGAVGPDTQLYDAQADHWGPAHTHEIFHTLSRETGEDGFVPPPSPVPPPATSPIEAAKARENPTPPPKSRRKEPEPASTGGFDLGLTLADPPPVLPEPETSSADALDLSVDLAAPTSAAAPKKGAPAPPAEPPGTFDFGDLGGGLRMEDSPLDVGSSHTPAAGDGLALETPMQFTGGMASEGFGGGGADLGLEGPAAFASGAPAWSPEPPEGGAMDFSSAVADASAEEAAPLPVAADPTLSRRAAKDRPSAPKFKRQRSLSGPIVLVVILLALGVGGYVGWPILSARLAEREVPEEPVFVLPPIPPELLPRMRALAEGAIADVIAEVDRSTAAGVPSEPDQQWLGGNYLANAGQFASIEAFWTSFGDLMQAVRAADPQRYSDRFAARAQAEGIAADTVTMLVERADAGLTAAAAARDGVYASMDRVVDAALALHDFLVENDANIDYRPAAVSTADPILEAVPNSPALGTEMVERIAAYTDALDDALGELDRATRARLISALVTRLQQVGIQ